MSAVNRRPKRTAARKLATDLLSDYSVTSLRKDVRAAEVRIKKLEQTVTNLKQRTEVLRRAHNREVKALDRTVVKLANALRKADLL